MSDLDDYLRDMNREIEKAVEMSRNLSNGEIDSSCLVSSKRREYQMRILDLLKRFASRDENSSHKSEYKLTSQKISEMQEGYMGILAEIRLGDKEIDWDIHQPHKCSFMYIEGFPFSNQPGRKAKSLDELLKERSRALDALTEMHMKGVQISIGWPEMDKDIYKSFERLIPGLVMGEESDRFIGQDVDNPLIKYCVFLGAHTLSQSVSPRILGSALYGTHVLSRSKDARMEHTVAYGLHALSGSQGAAINGSLVKGRWALSEIQDCVLIGAEVYTESDFLDSENCVLINCRGNFSTDRSRNGITVYNGVHPEMIPSHDGLNASEFIEAIRKEIPNRYRR